MREPSEVAVALGAGQFRALHWEGAGTPIVFLHGLTAIADVWQPTVDAVPPGSGSYWAFDQRGHGDSPAPADGYSIAAFVRDLFDFVEALKLDRPHLAGHSMGARVALVAAARHPRAFRSVAVVDIGPERWAKNWRETVASIERMPATFSEEEALAFFTRNRPTSPDRQRLYLARLRGTAGGQLTWRGSPDAWRQTVISHRSRDFWHDWDRIGMPALLIRGGDSNELRPRVAAEMRQRNGAIQYEELAGIGHNIPLLAPGRLAARLSTFWAGLA